MDAAQVQDIVQAALVAAAADAATKAKAAAALAPQVVPVVFSLMPGVVNTNIPWNYSSREGIKIYFAVMKAMEPKYDGLQLGLKVFLNNIVTRAQTFGWDALILTIPDIDGTNRDLLQQ
jgi:hypothetical protein